MAHSHRLRPTGRRLTAWPVELAEGLDLLGIPPAGQAVARMLLERRGLVVDGRIDLANLSVAAVLELPMAQASRALADAKAEARAMASRRADAYARRMTYGA